MGPDTYAVNNYGGVIRGCIDLVESPDDGGWYAQEYDFKRKDSATRTSAKIYPDRDALIRALKSGKHRWNKWD
jgi:hypothetical protein